MRKFKLKIKALLMIASLLLPGSPVYSGSVTYSTGGTGRVTYTTGGTGNVTFLNTILASSSITFYASFNSATSGLTPEKCKAGTTINTGASVTAESFMVGNGLRNNNVGNSGGRISFATSTSAGNNIDLERGVMGFYFLPYEISSGRPMWVSTNTNAQFIFKFLSGSTFEWKYRNLTVTQGLSAGTTYFVEVAWDATEAAGFGARIRLNNGSWQTASGIGGSSVVAINNNVRFEGFDGNAVDSKIDQVIISNNPLEDLYSIRDQTEF